MWWPLLLLLLLMFHSSAGGLGAKRINFAQLTCDNVHDNNTDVLQGCRFSVISRDDLQVTCIILSVHTGSSDLVSAYRTKLLDTLTFRILPPTHMEQQGVYCAYLQSVHLRKWSKDIPDGHTVGVLAAGFLSFISLFSDDSYGHINFTKQFPVAKIYVHSHCRGLFRQQLKEDCIEKVIFLTDIIHAAYNWTFTNDDFWPFLLRRFVGELGAELTHLSLVSSDLLTAIPVSFLTQHLSPDLHMRVLKLADMTIGQLEKPLLIMPTLHELSLPDDNISRVSEAALEGVPWLLKLDLSGNELEDLPQLLPARLENLNVSRNRMIALNARLPQSLIILNVSFNNLETLPEPLPGGLQKLDASNNRLRRLPQRLPAGLWLLAVSHNLLLELPQHLPPALQVLQVSHNRLQTLCPQLLVPLQTLRLLDASHNGLSAVEDLWLSHQMELLNVSHNQLRRLNLLGPGYVSYIDASYNDIQSWKVRGHEIALVGNPGAALGLEWSGGSYPSPPLLVDLGEDLLLDCDPCSPASRVALQLRCWLLRQMSNASAAGPRVVRPLRPVCSGPWPVAGTPLLEAPSLEDSPRCPGSARHVAQSALLGVLLLAVVAVVCAVCYCRRYEITYMMHLMEMRRERVAAERRNSGSYKYDAFVCYSSADREWVVDQLVPHLETAGDSPDEVALRLCLHERDFPLGSYIADNIVTSMKTSRSTVIVLSQAFVDSRWCRWELDLASQKVHHLVLLELERLERHQLERHLRFLMDTRTYLTWPSQPSAQHSMWRRLRAVLTAPAGSPAADTDTDGADVDDHTPDNEQQQLRMVKATTFTV
ncbi:toll-like receptor 2 type-2 isoform X1 [Schistocerca americana]|uniref:toll-like receptor 2 type-2 isoform X1 n=1 Tax=Schistocerca americana TaxID=7009 RepID=UPI001F4F64AF|nr:toll-like receptor 2 type-2 isoform X1 [Schistocerca americana]